MQRDGCLITALAERIERHFCRISNSHIRVRLRFRNASPIKHARNERTERGIVAQNTVYGPLQLWQRRLYTHSLLRLSCRCWLAASNAGKRKGWARIFRVPCSIKGPYSTLVPTVASKMPLPYTILA